MYCFQQCTCINNASYSSAKLPKWCGERPGKKMGDPSSPEDEETKDEGEENIEDIGLIEDAEAFENEEEEDEDEDEEEGEEADGYEYE